MTVAETATANGWAVRHDRREGQSHIRTRWIVAAAAVVAAMVIAAVATILPSAAHATYVPHNAALRQPSLYFFPPHAGRGPARAFVLFFGNDVGFWEAHQQLADDLARQGFAVVGVDVRPLLSALPDGPTAADSIARSRAFADTIATLIEASRRELAVEKIPVILTGHSVGAELAIWTGANVPIPGLVGIVAISPRARGHLRATLRDITNVGNPDDPGSFAVAQQVAALPQPLRIAIVRGVKDKYRYADSLIVPAGGQRLRLELIPFAAHSLRRILLARYVVRRAMDWVLG